MLSYHEVKWSEVAQSCPTLCDPMDCSPPGSSVHGIFQARILEWVAISFSRGSSRPRDWTRVSCIVGRCFTIWASPGKEPPKQNPGSLPRPTESEPVKGISRWFTCTLNFEMHWLNNTQSDTYIQVPGLRVSKWCWDQRHQHDLRPC